MDIISLLAQSPAAPPDKKCLHRLLYIQVVTILECYLSDLFISRVKADKKLLRKLIETTLAFKAQNIAVADVFQTMDALEKRANSYLAGLVWHRLDDVAKLYGKVLGVIFPSDVNSLRSAIGVRHELVHRNGEKADGTEHEIDDKKIKNAITLAEKLVDHIKKGWSERPVADKQESVPPSGELWSESAE